MIGQDHRIINSRYHPKEFIRNIWTTIASGKTWHGELRNRAKDGSIYWVDTTIVPFVDESGKPLQYIAIRFDLTGRKMADERILQQAALINKTNDAIFVCDLDQKILLWNKGAERIYGWQSDEVVGKDLCDVLYDGQRNQIDDGLEILLSTGEWNSETKHTAKDGKRVMIERRWTLVRNDLDQPDYVLIINTDITESKTAQEQLFRAQRMESIGTLAGGIAHDLNNILSPILMGVDILRMNDHDTETERWLGIIKENTERGADLVKQVLTFARGVSGDRVSVQLKHIIKELVGVLVDTMPKSISVKYDIEPGLWFILADPSQLHQVLMNVCINARDAMPSGGTLTIKANNINVDENYARMNIDAFPGNYVLLTVTDTGTGMSAEVLQRIFDPFFTTKQIGEGTGLGLSTTQTIVKSHGGFISVYSELSKGSRFSMYLPSGESQSSIDTAKAKDKLPRGRGELILIVDDEENIRDVAEATMSKFGYRTISAVDGTDALGVYAKQSSEIALVLTDMAMPFMDGAALIRALKRLNPSVNIIAMSGFTSSGTTAELASLDIEGFLSKPFSAEDLLTMLDSVLRDH